MKWPFCCVCLLLAPSVWGQTPHPRIWLDSTTLTRLNTLKAANDATWRAFKASADTYAAATVEAYSATSCKGGDICYPYEGQGWFDAVATLALAYQMTGTTSYCTQVKAIMAVAVSTGVTAMNQDSSRYSSRYLGPMLALAFDWCYSTLSSTDKTNYTALADSYWADVNAHAYQWDSLVTPATAYGNFFIGHLYGMGLMALAIEGDDSNSTTIQTAILNAFNTIEAPAWTTDGGFQGGFASEGYNYGLNSFIRLFSYMRAMTTCGKTDLWNNDISWMKAVAKATIHLTRPDLWSILGEGDWPGAVTGVEYRYLARDMSGFLNGTTEGGWMVSLYNNFTTPPDSGIYGSSTYLAPAFDAFFYNTGQSAIDYTATQPTYVFLPGDQHTIVRTDWTTSAVHTTFRGGTIGSNSIPPNYGDHAPHAAGNIGIKRGADLLLVDAAGMWKGTDGVTGTPGTNDLASWHWNTLYYWDQGTRCVADSAQYAGCQNYWSTFSTPKHNEGTGFAFQEAPLQAAYLVNGGLGTITDYSRSFVNISDITFVFDRVTAPSTSTRHLMWHVPALSTAAPPGNASANSLSGGLATVTVGKSKLWINTLLPVSPTINQSADRDTWTSSTAMGTQRFEVSDPAAGSCSTNCLFLTVLAPTASSVSSMPTTTLITTSKYKGGFYNDGTLPRIALFSADGTSQTSVTYTASYSSTLTGRHVILDLVPGTYNVTKDGTTLYSGLTVGADGSLSFTATGGTTYSITQIGGPPATNSPSPPTGLGGMAR